MGWSIESVQFVNSLLQRKPTQRLGVNGPEEVREHPWLRDTPWEKYRSKSIASPFIPDENLENYVKSTRLDTFEDQSILHNEATQQ